MKKDFAKPSCEIVRFTSNVIATSGCTCYYPEIGEDLGSDDTCTGANIACTCNPNQADPSANCA